MQSGADKYEDIELVVGPYRSGKTTLLIEQALKASLLDPFAGVTILVPSVRYRGLVERKIREALSKSDSPGCFGIKVVPFYRACQSILQQAGRTSRVLSDDLRPLLVQSILRKLHGQNELSNLAAIATSSGTAASLLELIDAFERSGYSPDEITAQVEKSASQDSRYKELATIYGAYWNELDRLGYVDQRRLAFSARELLSAEVRAGEGRDHQRDSQESMPGIEQLPKLGVLFIDGFDRVSRLQRQVFAGLAKCAAGTKIFFDYLPPDEDKAGDYHWKESSYNELANALNLTKVTWLGADYAKPAITSNTVLDRFSEMQEIARLCKKAIVEEGVAASKLLVVARDLKRYHGFVELAFQRAGLNYFIDHSVSLAQLPVVHFITRLLKLPSSKGNYSRAELIATLSSPYCDLEGLGLKWADVYKLDRLSLKHQLVSGKERWLKLAEGAAVATHSDSAEANSANTVSANTLNTNLYQGLQLLFKTLTPVKQRDRLSNFAAFVEDALENLLLLPEGQGETASKTDVECWQAYRGVRAALRTLVQEEHILSRHELISYDNFLQTLDTMIESSNFRLVNEDNNAIVICNAELAPNRSFSKVFVSGMVEGEFPRRQGRSGFVSNEEINQWLKFGVDISDPRQNPGFETGLFHSLLERASDAVHLFVPFNEMNGEELIPSLFIEETGESKWLAPFEDSITMPVSAEDAISAHLWWQGKLSRHDHFAHQPETNILWQELEPGINSALSRSSGPTIYNSWLTDFVETGVCSVRSPEYWSASAINEYGKCPFRYWVGRELNIEPHEEPEPGVDVRLRGTLFHKVMEQFYKELFAKQISLADLSAEQRYELLVRVLHSELEALENEPNFEKDKFWPYVKSDMRFRLARFVEREAQRALKEKQKDINYVPAYFEVGFGRGKPADSAAVEIGNNTRFGGIVDRIDIAQAGTGQPAKLRIIDYKSSTGYISNHEVINGSNLQLPLYMMAAEKVVANAQVLEGYYLSLVSGERIGSIDLRKDDHKDVMQKAKQNLARIVASIKSGDFAAKPVNASLCPKCDHKTVCRIREIGESKGEGYDEAD